MDSKSALDLYMQLVELVSQHLSISDSIPVVVTLLERQQQSSVPAIGLHSIYFVYSQFTSPMLTLETSLYCTLQYYWRGYCSFLTVERYSDSKYSRATIPTVSTTLHTKNNWL